MKKSTACLQLYLRLALGIGFLVPGLDRLGVWGPPGGPHISWGDWTHFAAYARQVMSFLPTTLADAMAVLATTCEIGFGILLILGWRIRLAAIGSGILTLGFALSMAISFGIVSPLNYSVFAFSAGSLLLSTLDDYPISLDNYIRQRK